MKKPLHQEMEIQKSRTVAHNLIGLSVVIAIFLLFAIINLLSPSGIISLMSALFLPVLLAVGIWKLTRYVGGPRQYLLDLLGETSGRHFMSLEPGTDVLSSELCFGYYLFGKRFLRKRIPIDTIESVEWDHGQAPGMAGRGPDDWHVKIWYDHGDPDLAESRREWSLKPYQDQYVIEPADRPDRAEALGLTVASFLHTAGTNLKKHTDTCYCRELHAA